MRLSDRVCRCFRAVGFAAVVAVGAWVAGQARADSQFAWQAVPASSHLLPGQTTEVSLYLTETFTDGTSRFLDEQGLSQVGLTIERQATGSADPASILDFALNLTDFGSSPPVAGDAAGAVVNLQTPFLATSGPVGQLIDPGVRRVLLLTLTVEAGDSEGTTRFDLRDDPAFDETFTFGGGPGNPLDALIEPAVFEVTTVPEPTGLGLIGLGALALLRQRRRRVPRPV